MGWLVLAVVVGAGVWWAWKSGKLPAWLASYLPPSPTPPKSDA